MTSPVDTSVKWFSSSMSGAPVLNGVAGSLVALFDALLKDGFDTKTGVSIVVASGIATATWSAAHSCDVDAVVLIAGVTGALVGLNGEQKIATKPNATTATWLTAEANGTATGTITMKMAPLGWTKVYTAANKAVYKSSDVTSSGFLLRVDDAGTTFARVVGYEAMSDVDTGTNPFPTAVQMSGGGYWPKSINASATATAWQMFGDSRVFFYNPMPGTSTIASNQIGTLRGFGDPIALKASGDVYACFLNYSVNSAVTSQIDGGLESNSALSAMPRAYTGLGTSVLHYAQSYIGANTVVEYSGVTGRLGNFPGDVDGGMYLSKKFFSPSGQNYPRAEIPGVYHIPQGLAYDSFKPGLRVPGTRDLAGRNLMAASVATTSAFSTGATSSSTGIVMVDVTGPWRT